MRKKKKFPIKIIQVKKIIYAAALASLIIMHIKMYVYYKEGITVLEESLKEQLILHSAIMLESVDDMVKETILSSLTHEMSVLKTEINEYITSGVSMTGGLLKGTNERIQRIDRVYSDLLHAQQKRTLDSLYTEASLIEKEQDAGKYFIEGDYVQSRAHYAVISQSQPENLTARFYYLYSLFLINKQDRANYAHIKDGLEVLERQGYHRVEIREVLEYIGLEEEGIKE